MSADPSVTAWIVQAEGDEIGRFDNFDDAEGFAAAWNARFPNPPWFVVVAQPSALSPVVPASRVMGGEERG